MLGILVYRRHFSKICVIDVHLDEKAALFDRAAVEVRLGKFIYQLFGPFSAKTWTRKSMNARTFGWVKRPGG